MSLQHYKVDKIKHYFHKIVIYVETHKLKLIEN